MGKHADRGLRRGQGYTERRTNKDGSISYVARWREGGKLRAKTFHDPDPDVALEAAEAHVRAMHRATRSGRYIPPSELTVMALVNQYLERGESRWEPNTYATYSQWCRGMIEQQIGAVRVREFDVSRAQHWIDQLRREGWQPKTIHGARVILSGAFAEAVRLGIVERSPVSGLTLPRIERTPHQTWTTAEIDLVLSTVAGDAKWHALYRLILTTGMRPGEIRALRWGDIALDRSVTVGGTMVPDPVLVVRRTMTKDRLGRPVVGDNTKTDRQRALSLPPLCVAALRTWRTEQKRVRLAAPSWEDGDYVFTTRSGRPLSQSNWQQYHVSLCRRAGVPVITHHELRHTMATVEMEAGTHPLIVSDRLGHARIETTLNVYSHASPALHRQAAVDLERRLGGVQDTTTSPGGEPESGAKMG